MQYSIYRTLYFDELRDIVKGKTEARILLQELYVLVLPGDKIIQAVNLMT
jgi:hypothetical protein